MLSGRGLATWFLCSLACRADGGRDVDTTAGRAAPPPASPPGSTGAGRSVAEAAPSAAGNPLLAAIRDTLRARNPAIGSVRIIEQRSVDYATGPSVIIAYGVRADRDFRGSFQDELFGIFVANDSLTRVVRTLEVLPTPRWLDYSVRIVRLAPDSVRVEGRGASYGDQPLERAYPLTAPDPAAPPPERGAAADRP